MAAHYLSMTWLRKSTGKRFRVVVNPIGKLFQVIVKSETSPPFPSILGINSITPARLVLSQIQFNKEQENVGEQRKKATALL